MMCLITDRIPKSSNTGTVCHLNIGYYGLHVYKTKWTIHIGCSTMSMCCYAAIIYHKMEKVLRMNVMQFPKL